MGIKKLFKIKPPEEETPEQNRDTLMELGISTKNPNRKRKEKFAAYGQFARDREQDTVYAPPGYENYGRLEVEEDLNKSALDGEIGSGSNIPNQGRTDPYSISSGGTDPYAVSSNNAYSGDPYAKFQNRSTNSEYSQWADGYGSQKPIGGDSYGGKTQYNSAYDGLNNYNNHATGNSGISNDFRRNINSYNGERTAGSSQANPYDGSRDDRMSPNPYSSSYQNMNNRSASGPVTDSSIGAASHEKPVPKAMDTSGSNPYASLGSDSYASTSTTNVNPYARSKSRNLTSSPATRLGAPHGTNLNRTASTAGTVDLNSSPLDSNSTNAGAGADEFDFEEGFGQLKNTLAAEELDLNATINETERGDDLNATIGRSELQQAYQQQPQWQIEEEEYQSQQEQGYGGLNNDRGFKTFEDVQREEEARQQQEEDEAVDEIKQEIRFTKQSSVASTRNTLKMAQDAEMSGMNTLGMLGHQSEKLNSIERNLDLMKVQNKIADDKVAELKKLNRSILAVHVSNPFNSRRRQREREEKIKGRKIEEKMMQEHTSQQLSNSTQRIEGALRGNDEINTVREKYQKQQILTRAKKYQFENDEEDDMMEVEIDKNLDQIQQVSGRLKKLAIATGEELDSQQRRVKNIEDSTDDLDIRIHLNTTRLAGIR
ncbi:hypothetical protein HG536_0D04780 [Torulaspora globosa]|uniref:Protein transport protein SEC9 n=1 Tax=Torulaspora globosa TaxID=48254 RepID=A0A7G3ZHH0_9SACH|nr:uncharacterized protein HG536_0D04780 [Torulaspora globosa]QLL32956.1 hypothetical protein HG536_0D04780 [Torulaspora globosa]